MAVNVHMPKTHDISASIKNLQIASAIFSERDINKSQVCDIYDSKIKQKKNKYAFHT